MGKNKLKLNFTSWINDLILAKKYNEIFEIISHLFPNSILDPLETTFPDEVALRDLSFSVESP